MPIDPSQLLLPPPQVKLVKSSNSKINRLIAWRKTWIPILSEERLKASRVRRPRRRKLRTVPSRDKMVMSCPEWRARAQPIAATLSVQMLSKAKLPHSWFFLPLPVRAISQQLPNSIQLQLPLLTLTKNWIQHREIWSIRIKCLRLPVAEAALSSRGRGSSGHRSPRSSLWATS